MFFEALRSHFTQLHFLTLRAEPADGAKAFPVGCFEVLCRLNVTENTFDVCGGQRFDWLICVETGLQM